jgi:hypothetical protein
LEISHAKDVSDNYSHCFVHAGLAAAPNPADSEGKPGVFYTSMERSWLPSQLGLSGTAVHWIGILLVVLSTPGFVLAGLDILGVTGLRMIWRIAAIISACISMLLLILFRHPWLPKGVLMTSER